MNTSVCNCSHWVGQKDPSGFSVPSYIKLDMNLHWTFQTVILCCIPAFSCLSGASCYCGEKTISTIHCTIFSNVCFQRTCVVISELLTCTSRGFFSRNKIPGNIIVQFSGFKYIYSTIQQSPLIPENFHHPEGNPVPLSSQSLFSLPWQQQRAF